MQDYTIQLSCFNEVDPVAYTVAYDTFDGRYDGQGCSTCTYGHCFFCFFMSECHCFQKCVDVVLRLPVAGIVLSIFEPHAEVKHCIDCSIEFVFLHDLSAQVYVVYAEEDVSCKTSTRLPSFIVCCYFHLRVDA